MNSQEQKLTAQLARYEKNFERGRFWEASADASQGIDAAHRTADGRLTHTMQALHCATLALARLREGADNADVEKAIKAACMVLRGSVAGAGAMHFRRGPVFSD